MTLHRRFLSMLAAAVSKFDPILLGLADPPDIEDGEPPDIYWALSCVAAHGI